MCFNYKVSLLTFTIGTLFSIILIKYGNKRYKSENIISGIFLIFISLIQFMDFLLWIDIKNNLGINYVTTIIGPILNIGQPLILFLIKYVYYKPNLFEFNNFNLPVAAANMLYLIYFIIIYIKFLSNERLITGVRNSNGHLNWPWIKYSNPWFYLVLFAINIFYLFNFNYALTLFIVTYFFLFVSIMFFNKSAGEIWCFFGSFIPLIMLCLSYYIPYLPFIF